LDVRERGAGEATGGKNEAGVGLVEVGFEHVLGHGDFGVEIGAGVVEWAVGEAVGGEDDVAAVGHFAQIGPGAETAAVGMGAGHVGFAVETDLRGGVGVRSDEKRRDGEPGAESVLLEQGGE
jgi:hypothetical protein